jgi:hypothetical protein
VKHREKVAAADHRELTDRDLVSVYGHIKHVTLAPRAGTPTLEAALYDGSGVVTLVWLGRRTIVGVKPGAAVAHGRVSCHEGRPGHLQPALTSYELPDPRD